MKSEKLPAKMEYWRMRDDGLELPILIGIEHSDGDLHGVFMNNLNTGRSVNLKGVEVEAIINALVESGSKIDGNDMPLFHIS